MNRLYIITDGYSDFKIISNLEEAKREAESIISEGMGNSFEWTSDWYEFDGECAYQRDYSVDGEDLTIGIIID